jgi:hypothetical protein
MTRRDGLGEPITPGDHVLQMREIGLGQRRPGEMLVVAVDEDGIVLSAGQNDQPISGTDGVPRHFPPECFCKTKH